MEEEGLSSDLPPACEALTPEFVALQSARFDADPKLRLAQLSTVTGTSYCCSIMQQS